MMDVLSEGELKKVGCFNSKGVANLLREHSQGLKNHRQLIWPLMVFMIWIKRNRNSIMVA